jgi:hypothetical protein
MPPVTYPSKLGRLAGMLPLWDNGQMDETPWKEHVQTFRYSSGVSVGWFRAEGIEL